MFNRANLAVVGVLEKGKYPQGSVEFSPDWTMATDGHCLMAVKTQDKELINDAPMVNGAKPQAEFERFRADRETVEKVKKSLPHSPRIPIIENAFVGGEKDKRTLVTTDLSATATFPANAEAFSVGKWENAFPEKDVVFSIDLQADLLYRLVGAMKEAMKDKHFKAIKFSFYGPEDAVRLDAETDCGGQEIKALIMPCKP